MAPWPAFRRRLLKQDSGSPLQRRGWKNRHFHSHGFAAAANLNKPRLIHFRIGEKAERAEMGNDKESDSIRVPL